MPALTGALHWDAAVCLCMRRFSGGVVVRDDADDAFHVFGGVSLVDREREEVVRKLAFGAAGRRVAGGFRPVPGDEDAVVDEVVSKAGKSGPQGVAVRCGDGGGVDGQFVVVPEAVVEVGEVFPADAACGFVVDAVHEAFRE